MDLFLFHPGGRGYNSSRVQWKSCLHRLVTSRQVLWDLCAHTQVASTYDTVSSQLLVPNLGACTIHTLSAQCKHIPRRPWCSYYAFTLCLNGCCFRCCTAAHSAGSHPQKGYRGYFRFNWGVISVLGMLRFFISTLLQKGCLRDCLILWRLPVGSTSKYSRLVAADKQATLFLADWLHRAMNVLEENSECFRSLCGCKTLHELNLTLHKGCHFKQDKVGCAFYQLTRQFL